MEEILNRTLLRRIRDTLHRGDSVAIVGWKQSNHNSFTASLPKNKVLFVEAEVPRARVGLALTTRFVSHALVAQIKKQRIPMYKTALMTGTIKRLLLACQDQLEPHREPQAPAPEKPASAAGSPAPENHDDILDFITAPDKELTMLEKFAEAFLREASQNNGLVGTRTLSKLAQAHGVEGAPSLVKAGWIVPETGPGKTKIGWYRAGKKMLEFEREHEPLPSDPVERARFIITKEEEILAEKTRGQTMVDEADAKLTRIAQAKDLLKQLGDLFEP